MQPKTPVLSDKRLWLSVATIISLLVASFLGVQLDVELLATIAATVIGYVTNSAIKEARVASVMAGSPSTLADAAKVLAAAAGPQP